MLQLLHGPAGYLLAADTCTCHFHADVASLPAQDAFPDMPSVVSDLSPFYLARARDNLRYWKSVRQPGRQLSGVDGSGADFLQTAAEAIAAPDESFDIVSKAMRICRARCCQSLNT